VLTSYFTFKEIINTHNKQQQQAIIPLFSLVTNEIIHPLAISSFMANDQFIIDYAQQEKVDKEKILPYLQRITKRHKTVSFLAVEKHNLMIDSNNNEIQLSYEKSEWYYRLKKELKTQFADIGNADNPHLFFDSKIINEQQQFLGFAGVAIDLNYFANKFSEYKKRFGFELFFVDKNNDITLSSTSLMRTESHHRKNAVINIDTLTWYAAYQLAQQEIGNTESMITFNNDHVVVSQMPLKELNWTMFIVSPPPAQQSEYWQLFLTRFSVFILVILVLYYFFIRSVNYFKANLIKDTEIDFLTKLPNRSFIHWKFEDLTQHYNDMSVVIADIDHFKKINDTYGHIVGDEVLKAVADNFSASLRKDDVTGRWGGEEFIMLLPSTSSERAKEVTERIRKKISEIPFSISSTSQPFSTTVSFGICHNTLKNSSLKSMISKADKALYAAKTNGRNQIVIYDGRN
jgi:diguanylate cyclase (GGDEF)-like protein